MTLRAELRAGLVLPVICAPMFLVSGPDLVRAACASGLLGVLPRHNARTFEQFDSWLTDIRRELDEIEATGRTVGPLAVNLSAKVDHDELPRLLDSCDRHRIQLVISATGNPADLTARVHDWGGSIFHDVTTIRFAEKAISAGVDGVICIGAGGGGHSGTVSHLALIPKVRSMFDGTIVAAGAISNGAAVRAMEVLGADLSYLGTRFIASAESMAPDAYKQMLVDSTAADLSYSAAGGGVPANWLRPSLANVGVDPAIPSAHTRFDRLPPGFGYWKDVWSAGHGVEIIQDVPTVAELVARLRGEYAAACRTPDMLGSALGY